LSGALKQASGSGVETEGIVKLKKFEKLYQRGKELSKNPGQAPQAEKILGQALRLDAILGGGRGVFHKDIKSKLAKVYFVMGADAKTRKKYGIAFQYLHKALKFRPDLKQAQTFLKNMERDAHRMYESAYVFQSTDPEKALKMCRTVKEMVRSDSYPYVRCTKLIKKLSVPVRVEDPIDDEGF
jgi:tetratricopeptide (TPR) repeat protein